MKAYIKSIEYYFPKKVEKNPDNRLTKKTGILQRHICEDNQTASDLAYEAAQKLFNNGVKKENIDFIILCTQSPDYFLPTTACILQDRLGLAKNCGAFDFNLGCSGYIYGLSIAKGLIESGQAQNILFLTSETYSKYINENDGAIKPLFSDGASATLISAIQAEKTGLDGFVLGSNGSGYNNLIVPVGGMREPFGKTKIKEYIDDFGNYRTNYNLCMKGSAISDFALEVVPDTLNKVLEKCGLSKSDIDYFVFHQANKFMLDFLQMKCDLMDANYYNDVSLGNTVSSSIPIALKDMIKSNKNIKKVLSIGFGVGLSWGGCVIDLSYYS